MLRAVLAMFTDYARATAIAATIGQAAAVLLGILGVMSGNFILAIIAVMIFFGAGMESFQAKAKTVLTTLRVGDAYNKHALSLVPADRISRVVDYILTSYARLRGGAGRQPARGRHPRRRAQALAQHRIRRGLAKDATELAGEQGRFTIFVLVDALTRLTAKVQSFGDGTELDAKAATLLALAA